MATPAAATKRRRRRRTPPSPTPFGERLATYRRDRGFTQTALAERIGVTQRVISYYERRANRPPAHLLTRLAEVLEVSLDELTGIKPGKTNGAGSTSRLWRRLREIEKLPPGDRKAILKMLDGLLARQKLQGRS